ncbi:MAG: hypothetical protein II593_02650, partial [Prevotella sp.]|nr:hypothetical protein [Prevotella sp.]
KVFSRKDFGKMSAIVCGFMTMVSLAALTACSDNLEAIDEGNSFSLGGSVSAKSGGPEAGISASKLKEIESFLASHLSQYFMPTCVFSTVKPEHKRATGVADSDEVAVFVSKCKQAFASTSGRKLLREAGKRAGLSDKGCYTIVWRHTDLGVNSDREEFTFHINAQ